MSQRPDWGPPYIRGVEWALLRTTYNYQLNTATQQWLEARRMLVWVEYVNGLWIIWAGRFLV